MYSWFLLTLISISVLAISEVAQKISLTRKDNISAQANNFIVWTVQGIASLLFVIIFNINLNVTLNSVMVINLILISCLYFIAGTLFYTSYKGQSVSISIILMSFSVVVSTLLGIIFFNEGTNTLKFVGILIILIAIIFVNYQKKERFNKYNLFALAGGILYGIAYTVDKSFVTEMNPHVYQILFCFGIATASLLFSGKLILKDLRRIKLGTFKIALLSGFTFFLYNKLNFISYSIGGEVGKIDAINNSAVFLIIILEIIILKDKTNLKKKILAAFIAVIGIVILGSVN